jgi:cytochrome c-type biogenesis protein CcmH
VNSAFGFVVIALVLLGVVVAVLALAYWRGVHSVQAVADNAQEVAQANARVYRDQLEELERDYLSGSLSQAALHSAREDLARRLLEDVQTVETERSLSEHVTSEHVTTHAPVRKPWWMVSGLVVWVPLLSLVMYGLLGTPVALDPQVVAQGQNQDAEVTPEKLATMATALIRRLQDEPNSLEGWVMLGRVQRARGLFDEADEALVKALAMTQDDDLLIERAEVLAQKSGGNFAGEPWAIIQRVLTRDPHHLNALLLAGSASFTELNYRSALRFWERAREEVDANSPDAAELERAMAEARDKLGLPPMPERVASDKPKAGVAAVKSISGRVSVVSDLASKVAPSDTVFVYATPVSGSRMPVAMLRTTADKLPLDFVLDDSMAMTPSSKLSDMAEVTVRVRISKSGQAMAQPGDLGVSLSPVKPGSQGLNLTVRDTLR